MVTQDVEPRAGDGLWAPARRGLTVGLVLSTTFIAVEALAVITIMPHVARDLGGLSLYGWVFSAFMLGSLIGTVLAGKQLDRGAPAPAFVGGIALFVGGLTVAGLAPSMSVLVVGRTLQGIGAGAIPAVSYVAIGRSLPVRLQPRMMAVLSSAWALPGLMGPALAAAVLGLFGWRWVFLGLIPLVLAAALLALPSLARLGVAAEPTATAHRLRDAVRVAGGSALAIGGLSAHGWLLAAAPLGGLVLAAPALRRLLPAGTLLARGGLPAVILTRGLLTFAFFGGDAFVTLTVTTVLHHSTAAAGLVVTLATLSWTAGSWLQVRLTRRLVNSAHVQIGLLLMVAGIAGMVLALRSAAPVGVEALAWSVAGLGMGLAYAPTSLMTLHEASAASSGWASASLNLADVLGTALGTGLGGAAIAIATDRGWSMANAVTIAFAVAGVGAIVALACSGRLPRYGPER